jgi:hypothetical protein
MLWARGDDRHVQVRRFLRKFYSSVFLLRLRLTAYEFRSSKISRGLVMRHVPR